MKKTLKITLISALITFTFIKCDNATKNNTDITNGTETSGTTQNKVYLPKLNELQQRNLKGKVKMVINKDNTSDKFNENGFIIERISESTEYYKTTINYEYNSYNQIIKQIDTTIEFKNNNNISIYLKLNIYNDKNILLNSISKQNKILADSISCKFIENVNYCSVYNIELRNKYTNFYNSEFILIKKHDTSFYMNKIETDALILLDQNENVISRESNSYQNGIFTSKYLFNQTFNSNYQIVTHKSYDVKNDIKTEYVNNTYEYNTNNFISKFIRLEKGEKDVIREYSEYVLDDNKNWISRKVTENSVVTTETRTITYY